MDNCPTYSDILKDIKDLYNSNQKYKTNFINNNNYNEQIKQELTKHNFNEGLYLVEDIDLYDLFLFKEIIYKVLKDKYEISFHDNCYDKIIRIIKNEIKNKSIKDFDNVFKILIYWIIDKFGYNKVKKDIGEI